MTSVVQKTLSFIDLISDKSTNKKQKKCLLQTASERQVTAICEILYNIVYGELKVSKREKKALKTHSKLLNFLLLKKKQKKHKQFILCKYSKFIFNILKSVRRQILKTLK